MKGVVAAVLAAAAITVTVLAVRSGDAARDAPPSRVLHVAPDGRGDCTSDDRCSLADALARPRRDVVLALGSGSYPRFSIAAEHRHLTLRPAVGEDPVAEAIEVHAPNTRVQDLDVDGGILVSRQGAGAVITGVRARALAIHGDDTTVRGSTVGDTTDKDPIQITESASGVLIEGNQIGDGGRGDGRGHVDCIQVTSGTDITIRRNDLHQCSNAALLVKPDLGDIADVLIEDNRLAACDPKGPACESGIALYVRKAAYDIARVIVRGNDVLGSSSFDEFEGLRIEDNVLQTFPKAPACPSATRGNTILARHDVACPLGRHDRYAKGAA